MINAENPIGIFDSGIGGLTVVQSLRKLLPDETLCYFGDTARVPYGTKSAETIKRYSVEITRFLKSHNVKMIVVACNTASAVALPVIRAHFDGPVLGVVEPGARAALRHAKRGRIGVIGTQSTVQSGAYQNHLLDLNPSLFMIARACPLFVSLVEEGWENDPITLQVAQHYLADLTRENLDVLIMGCTHYPLISHVIQQAVGEQVQLVSSAEEAAKETLQILSQSNLLAPQKRVKDLFYASDNIQGFQNLYERIFKNRDASFVEAHSEFFNLVQEIYRFRGTKLFAEPAAWFESIGSAARST
ncbi:MAG: glutamate racemase [Candidatus Omnitrophica bacterium]|nr:glutamate racemase [Candidatus Omnitrophota bacterium]